MSVTGVVYYNIGTSCLTRLLVSIYTLRKVYHGDIVIISEGEESNNACRIISNILNTYVVEINPINVPNKNHHFLVKTKLHEYTPFEQNVYIDADTLICGPIDELLQQQNFFVTQMHNWTPNTPTVLNRITEWRDVLPGLIDTALQYPVAINSGIFGFNINDTIMADWYNYAIKGINLFIPDEISLQIILPQYPHKLLGSHYNCSCVYGDINKARIIHYHGKKHRNLAYNGQLWIDAYNEVIKSYPGTIPFMDSV